MNRLNLVSPKENSIPKISIRKKNIHGIPLDSEGTMRQIQLSPAVENVHQLEKQLISRNPITFLKFDYIFCKFFWISYPINTRNRCYHNHVPSARKQSGRCTEPEFFNFFIDRKILFDVGTRTGNKGFWLVIIVIRNEVFYGIFWKKLLEFTVKLCCQSFVVTQDQCRFLGLLNQVGNRKSLARACHTEQNLCRIAIVHAFYKLGDSLWLVTSWLIFGSEFEFH